MVLVTECVTGFIVGGVQKELSEFMVPGWGGCFSNTPGRVPCSLPGKAVAAAAAVGASAASVGMPSVCRVYSVA